MNLILPVVAFIVGLFLAQGTYSERLKPWLATVLARVFIPVVIIYNMVFYQAGSLALMLFSFVVSLILFAVYMALFKERLGALCFSYVNMAWWAFLLQLRFLALKSVRPWWRFILAVLFLAIFGRSQLFLMRRSPCGSLCKRSYSLRHVLRSFWWAMPSGRDTKYSRSSHI